MNKGGQGIRNCIFLIGEGARVSPIPLFKNDGTTNIDLSGPLLRLIVALYTTVRDKQNLLSGRDCGERRLHIRPMLTTLSW